MAKQLLLGAEAVAQGAIDAGISGVYAYPGTPSTEITEYIQKSSEGKSGKIKSTWSANEKTAYEAALGMSYAGKRTLVCMKHVGLNVAADAFINSAITGVKGGLVVTVADDPSMHSSQNEQDSRVYGKFAMIPVIEPASQQELYDAIFYAYEKSEATGLPVLLRITTRIAHSRSGVERTASPVPQNELSPEQDKRRFVLLPAIARKRYNGLIEAQDKLVKLAEESPLNKIVAGNDNSLGVIAFGIAYNYIMEARKKFNLDFPVLKIGQYPLPNKLINEFFNSNDKILVAEEGYPVYEELLRGYFDNEKISGRMNHTLPRTGELTPDLLAIAVGAKVEESVSVPSEVAMRPPSLCKGCSHRDVYEAINMAFGDNEKHVFGDIGCYTLGALPPFSAISSTVDMGSSVTMAKGAADAGLRPAVAIIGDSTFTHSGITGLLDAVNDKSAITLIISDNDTTAMTGGQDSAGTGRMHKICEGIGVEPEHIRPMVPLKKNLDENIQILKEEFAYEGVSVILANRECIQTLTRKNKAKKKAEK